MPPDRWDPCAGPRTHHLLPEVSYLQPAGWSIRCVANLLVESLRALMATSLNVAQALTSCWRVGHRIHINVWGLCLPPYVRRYVLHDLTGGHARVVESDRETE